MSSGEMAVPGTTLRLPFRARSASEARRALRTALREVEASGAAVRDAELVLSELVSNANAFDHDAPLDGDQLEVRWTIRGGVVVIVVRDGGRAAALRATAQPMTALRGRGLSLVQTLSSRWEAGYERGTRVCAEVPLR